MNKHYREIARFTEQLHTIMWKNVTEGESLKGTFMARNKTRRFKNN